MLAMPHCLLCNYETNSHSILFFSMSLLLLRVSFIQLLKPYMSNVKHVPSLKGLIYLKFSSMFRHLQAFCFSSIQELFLITMSSYTNTYIFKTFLQSKVYFGNVLLGVLAYNLDPSIVMKCRSNAKAGQIKNLPCKVFLISFMECLPPSTFPRYLLEHLLFLVLRFISIHIILNQTSHTQRCLSNPSFVKRCGDDRHSQGFCLISRINQERTIANNPAVNLWKKLTVWESLVFNGIHWRTLH